MDDYADDAHQHLEPCSVMCNNECVFTVCAREQKKNESKNNPKSTCFVPEFADLEMSNIRRETLHGMPKGHQRPAGFKMSTKSKRNGLC